MSARGGREVDAALIDLTPEEWAHFDWTEAPHVARVLEALAAAPRFADVSRKHGVAARFVGGCVRDSLKGLAPKDIDIATPLLPEETMAALRAAGLSAHPTGVEHGTVTAGVAGEGIEITTLRADVSTDGRRAVVAFTDDWRTDSTRRDFTVNAMYLTPDRRLFDPQGGRADLAAGRVRFIGEADARIAEDYLRILRFFRFSARFAGGKFDADGLAACARGRDGIGRLSAERVGQEMTALLSLAAPGLALAAMVETGVLAEVWPSAPDIARAVRLKEVAPDAAAPLMMAALWPDPGEMRAGDVPETGNTLAARLRLSGADAGRMSAAARHASQLKAPLMAREVRRSVYEMGADGFRDALLLATAQGRLSAETRAAALESAEKNPPPTASPVSGRDALAAGLPPGPSVGKVIRAAERRWIDEDFPDEARARAILAEEIDAFRRS